MDSKTTDARISRTKLKERVTISRSQSRSAKARTEAQNAKRTASRTALPAADSNALAQMLLAQTLAGAGVANDAAKVSAITAGVWAGFTSKSYFIATSSGCQATEV